jgi:short-subunit dehydrogenase
LRRSHDRHRKDGADHRRLGRARRPARAAVRRRRPRHLVLVARRRDKLEELAAQLRAAHGIHTTVIAADLTDPKAPVRVHEEVTQAGIEVVFLVNNAGFGTNGASAELDLARELDLIELNVTALRACSCRRWSRGAVAAS